MMKCLFRLLPLVGLLFAAPAWAYPPGTGPAFPFDSNGKVPNQTTYSPAANLRAIGQTTLVGQFGLAAYSNATAHDETTRIPFTTKGPISQLRLFIPQQVGVTITNGGEGVAANQTFISATLEYGTQVTKQNFTVAGAPVWQVPIYGNGFTTDTLGVAIPANTSGEIRYATQIVFPPASGAAVAATGGGLAASTTYYYKATCIKSGAESGPSTEFSGTTGTSTLTLNLTLTATPSLIGCDFYKLYRSTTTGTELFLASIPYPTLTYADVGASTVAGQSVPTTATKYPQTSYLTAGMSTTAAACSGNQAISLQAVGALGAVGPLQCGVSTPGMILADDMASSSVMGMGDSIEAGQGVSAGLATTGYSSTTANWFSASMIALGFNSYNASITGSTAASFVLPTNVGTAQRWAATNYADKVFSELCTNDLYSGGTSWQQCALYQTQIGQALFQKGKKYYISTLLPRVSSADNMRTLSGQTPNAIYEPGRLSYNAWVRNGMQLSSGTPCNTAACGLPTPYIQPAYFDLAAALPEVNSSGVTTQGGGYWPVPASPVYSAQVLTGTPTLSSLPVAAASYTPHTLDGQVALLTSGAASGQSCVIIDNTATVLTCSTSTNSGVNQILTTAPSGGDQLSIYRTLGSDGTHPTLYGHQAIQAGSTGFQAWAAIYLAGF